MSEYAKRRRPKYRMMASRNGTKRPELRVECIVLIVERGRKVVVSERDGVRPRWRHTDSVGQSVVERAPGLVRSKCFRLTVCVRSWSLAEDPEHYSCLQPHQMLLHVSNISTRNHLQAFYGAQSSLAGRLCCSLAGGNSKDKRAAVEPCAQPRSSTAFHLTARELTHRPGMAPNALANGQRPSGNKGTESTTGAGSARWVCRNG